MQNEIEWWLFWGRVAGGLSRNQQVDAYQRLSATLLPHGAKKQRVNPSLLREMWRAAASLELLPMQTKIELGDRLAGFQVLLLQPGNVLELGISKRGRTSWRRTAPSR